MISSLYLIGIAEGAIAGLFFLLIKKRHYSSMTAGIFMLSLTLLQGVIARDTIFGHGSALSSALRHGLPFTYGPFLYLYTKFMIEEKQEFKKGDALHFLPLLLIIVLHLAGLTVRVPGEGPIRAPRPPTRGFIAFLPKPETRWLILFSAVNLSFLAYTVLILLRLRRHKKNIADYFSNETSDITLLWLKILGLLFFLSNILVSVLILFFPLRQGDSILNPNTIISYGLIFFIFVFSLFSGNQALIYEESGEESNPRNASKKYARSGLREDEIHRRVTELSAYMREKRPYLDCELTILDVSAALKLKRHHVSQILNDSLNVNFNTYINNLRTDYVIEKLKSRSGSDISLLELAMEGGFNSKTTFNRVFKERTGKTPSQYMRDLVSP